MLPRRTSIFTVLLLALSIAGFWYVELTTPARLAALAFLIAVGLYVLFNHRSDVGVGCALFFTIYDTNQYLFDHILPIWISVIVSVVVIALFWLVVFQVSAWPYAVASMLLVAEFLLAAQFLTLAPLAQAFVVTIPFIILCQYWYFRQYNILPAHDETGEN